LSIVSADFYGHAGYSRGGRKSNSVGSVLSATGVGSLVVASTDLSNNLVSTSPLHTSKLLDADGARELVVVESTSVVDVSS